MNKLFKFLLISVVIAIIASGFTIYTESLKTFPEGIYQIVYMIIFPLLILLVSIFYLKEPVLKDYFKSLLIPLCYSLTVIIILLLFYLKFTIGEAGMGSIFTIFYGGIVFLVLGIINLIVYFFRRRN